MRPFRNSSPFVIAVILSVGGSFACSSSSSPGGAGGSAGHGAGGGAGSGAGGVAGLGGAAGHGTGGTAGSGAGGSSAGGASGTDAGVDAHADAPADVPAGDAPAAVDSRADVAAPDVGTPDASPASITVTSGVLTQGAVFPAANTCAGINTSPPLTWTAGPTGTMSYTVALTDLTNGAVHWILYNIPATTLSLAAALPADQMLPTPPGGTQLHRFLFFGAGFDYRGPCPSGANHTYQFEVNAIPTTTLLGVTTGNGDAGTTSTTDQIQALAKAVSLGHGDLSGTSTASQAPPVDAGGQ